jgi:hypothetical protein
MSGMCAATQDGKMIAFMGTEFGLASLLLSHMQMMLFIVWAPEVQENIRRGMLARGSRGSSSFLAAM